MHESTVSRVTSNKYLSCERGLFELKYFFTSGIQSARRRRRGLGRGGEEPDQGADRRRGARRDPVRRPRWSTCCKAKGFDIARRTVAKYREAIGLGSSVQRRRQKAIGQGGLNDCDLVAVPSDRRCSPPAPSPEARLRAGLEQCRPVAAHGGLHGGADGRPLVANAAAADRRLCRGWASPRSTERIPPSRRARCAIRRSFGVRLGAAACELRRCRL